MNAPERFPLARTGAGHAPLRRPGSIRRTTSIDSDWPEGFGKSWTMTGRGRDLLTPADGGNPVELASGGFTIRTSPKREIEEIALSPNHPGVREMVGVRAGGASREALGRVLGDLRGSPTYQLLDDFAGASLVAGWIWTQWNVNWLDTGSPEGEKFTERRKQMVNICTGFAEGATSLEAAGPPGSGHHTPTYVEPLENPADPAGWHTMPFQDGPQKRRARRIDLWREDGLVRIDAAFQDSGSAPGGMRVALHEYRIHAALDPASGKLTSLEVEPLILPFVECPGAALKAKRMVGQEVAGFRTAVIETLPSTLGCTHLSDVLRALADIPALARQLPEG